MRLPYGVNIYRLLTDSALYKYIDATNYIIFQMIQDFDSVHNLLRKPGLVKTLGSTIASLQTSVGTLHVGTDTFVVWKLQEDANG